MIGGHDQTQAPDGFRRQAPGQAADRSVSHPMEMRQMIQNQRQNPFSDSPWRMNPFQKLFGQGTTGFFMTR
jgi:hypothetical protein